MSNFPQSQPSRKPLRLTIPVQERSELELLVAHLPVDHVLRNVPRITCVIALAPLLVVLSGLQPTCVVAPGSDGLDVRSRTWSGIGNDVAPVADDSLQLLDGVVLLCGGVPKWRGS